MFNCNDRARKLLTDKAQDPDFFRIPKMHGLILIKEPNVEGGARI